MTVKVSLLGFERCNCLTPLAADTATRWTGLKTVAISKGLPVVRASMSPSFTFPWLLPVPASLCYGAEVSRVVNGDNHLFLSTRLY